MVKIDHKRGDTFSYDFVAKDSNDVPVDLTGYSLRSHFRDKNDVLISTANITLSNAIAGEYVVTVSNTTSWPALTGLFMDIEYTSPTNEVESTETILIRVQKDITL